MYIAYNYSYITAALCRRTRLLPQERPKRRPAAAPPLGVPEPAEGLLGLRPAPRGVPTPGVRARCSPMSGTNDLSKRCLSNAASSVLRAVHSVEDHLELPKYCSRLKKTCV